MTPTPLETVRTVRDLREKVGAWRRHGRRVALVPTMGALHEGHLSLVRLGLEKADRVVASIFVNPAQFGPNEDFESYPRDETTDADMLAQAGCALLYAPGAAQMYPAGFATKVRVDGLAAPLCGAKRPGHFDGVALIVAKLLIQAAADTAIFGEKDWQQLAIIRRLAVDLDIPTQILGAPILREADGLAMSSRNRYLTAQERALAPKLNQVLRQFAEGFRQGTPADALEATGRAALLGAGFAKVDYLEARGANDLQLISRPSRDGPARVFGAAQLGAARLIDNIPL